MAGYFVDIHRSRAKPIFFIWFCDIEPPARWGGCGWLLSTETSMLNFLKILLFFFPILVAVVLSSWQYEPYCESPSWNYHLGVRITWWYRRCVTFREMLQVSSLRFRPNERPIEDIQIHHCTSAWIEFILVVSWQDDRHGLPITNMTVSWVNEWICTGNFHATFMSHCLFRKIPHIASRWLLGSWTRLAAAMMSPLRLSGT